MLITLGVLREPTGILLAWASVSLSHDGLNAALEARPPQLNQALRELLNINIGICGCFFPRKLQYCKILNIRTKTAYLPVLYHQSSYDYTD